MSEFTPYHECHVDECHVDECHVDECHVESHAYFTVVLTILYISH
jgi:hypothetical protein